MTEAQLRHIWNKTEGHCHFCGDKIIFNKRGWVNGKQAGYWEVDHVIQKSKGGEKSAENCLPACTRCNRLRWHRTGENLRTIMLFGVIALHEVSQLTEVGKQLQLIRKRRLINNKSRRSR